MNQVPEYAKAAMLVFFVLFLAVMRHARSVRGPYE